MDVALKQSDLEHEDARLAALDAYDILDTAPSPALDRLVGLTRKIFDVPMATITFIDGHRQWFKAREGVRDQQTCRGPAFCNVTIRQDAPLIVADTWADPRFKDNPFVQGAPHLRFYAGAQLRTPGGYNIGALCAMDTKPRTFEKREVAILTDLAHVVMSELEAQRLVSTDSLTGALSLRGFRSAAEMALALAQRHSHALSCILFDLDHFKRINDTCGHAVGDTVLAETVDACRMRLRKSDIFGRVGGEEFAVVLPHTTVNGAMKVAEELRAAVAELRAGDGPDALSVSASFGVATLDRSVTVIDDLIRRADTALFVAKGGGRNRCAAWEPPPQGESTMRRVFKAGQIAFNAGRSVIDCTVRGLSDKAASLEVVSTAGIPDIFKLNINADGIARRCTVITKLDRRIEAAFE